jgi:hypothetical protein
MRWLIRKVTKKGKGQVSFEEDVHYGDILTIGRGADQAVFLSDLRAAIEHARVTALGSNKYKVESLITAGIRVNGGIQKTATLGPGALIEIGGTRIELLAAPQDYDAGIEISAIDKAELAAEKEKTRKPTALSETWLSRRMPSWALLIVILVLFLALPLAAHYSKPVSNLLQSSPLPSRDAWLAGDLAGAHHFFGSDCNACHSEGTKWVKDEDCLACHGQTTPAHADPATFHLPALGEARCAHCHRDHNGKDGLVREDQALCADCHIGLKASTAGASTLEDVGDFGLDHPEFKVAMPAWDSSGAFAPERVTLSTELEENSGLKFPHDVHLDPEGLNAAEGRQVLVCASCHEPDAGKAIMKPVDFETMCQDCHALTFDVTQPERQVPHAKIQEIIYMLDEFYARRALEGDVQDAAAPESLRVRRRPGTPPTQAERQLALTWARDKARQVGESLFTGRACTVCHAVTPGRTVEEPWMVAPVRVAGVWFPKSRFDHGSHTTMVCADCHQAETSDTSTDLLLPGIENCQQCHAGEQGGHNKLESGCIACHGYHESPHLMQLDLQAGAKGAPAASD